MALNKEAAIQNSLSVVVDEYKKIHEKDRPELEIKMRIGNSKTDRSMFEKLMTYAKDKFGAPTIERTINVLSSNIYGQDKDKASYIRQMTFDDTAKKTDETYYKKSRVITVNMNGLLPYKVSVSKETPIEKFKSSTTCLIRIRLRYVFQVTLNDHNLGDAKDNKWRYDFTVVRELPCNKMSDIGIVAKQMFVLKGNEIPHGSYEAEIEYVGPQQDVSSSDLTVVEDLFTNLDDNFKTSQNIQETIYFAASHIIDNPSLIPTFQRNTSLKRLLKQAVAITKQVYSDIFPPVKYFVSKKLDGNRGLLVIREGKIQIITDRYYEFPAPSETGITILDVEVVYNKDKLVVSQADTKNFTLYILDVLMLKNEPIYGKKFADRHSTFADAAKLIAKYAVPIVAKKFIEITEDVEKSIRLALDIHKEVRDDGLIFNSYSEPYHTTNIYKWKPPEKNTIDFLVKKCPFSLINSEPYLPIEDKTLYFLFSGVDINMFNSLGMSVIPNYRDIFPDIARNRYFPIQFSPSDYPFAYVFYHKRDDLDGKIVELIWLPSDECSGKNIIRVTKGQPMPICWDLVRVRDDREIESVDYGNNFKVAEIIWQNYADPFRMEDLWNPLKSYFTRTRSNIYEAANSFNSYVKAKLIEMYAKGRDYVVDLASGRGADFKKYLMNEVKHALFVENDISALAELNRRKFEIAATVNRYQHRNQDSKISMKVSTMHADLNEPYEYNLAAITGLAFPPADAVFIHFAIHYMMETREAYTNFLSFVKGILKEEGTLTFTTMNGAKVFDLLKDKSMGERWSVNVPGTDTEKFAIEKRYSGTTFQKYGQTVAIKMAFTDTMIPEPLINIEEAIKDAKKCGFDLVERGSFADYLDNLKSDNRRIAELMTDDDKHYDGLYEFVTLRLKKVGGRRKGGKIYIH